MSMIVAFFTLANPILVIQFFLSYLSEGDVSVRSGLVYAIMLGLIIIIRSFVDSVFWMLNFRAAVRIKFGILALLYKKVLRLKTLRDKSIGDLANVIGNDGERIWAGIVMGPFILVAPMVIISGLVYCVVYLGPWALLSCLIVLGFFPFAGAFAKMAEKYREVSIKITDKRVGLISELLTSIKLVKMYVWETSFSQKISEIRASEKSIIEKSVFALSITMGSSMLVSVFASCLTFICYVATGNNLTPTQAFTFVALLNSMQGSLLSVPFALKSISEMAVTLKRIQAILLMDEINGQYQQPSENSLAVEIKNASFAWSSNRSRKKENEASKKPEEEVGLNEADMEKNEQIFSGPSLTNISLTIKKGQLVGVCGSVGCGKTSLINALLGRLDLSEGYVAVSGHSVAYAPQQAWITNDTVKNNIVFGHTYDADRYKQVVQACALTQDFQALPKGDVTEVGERGSNLSGGQKQRIALARAAYSYSDLVLLDDPLSSLDVHVGHHIFHNCILGLLKNRSVLLVTHSVQYLKDCDHILVMKEGTIVEQGSHDQLTANAKEYFNILESYNKKEQHAPNVSIDNGPGHESLNNETNVQETSILSVNSETKELLPQETEDTDALMKEEVVQKGVSISVIFQYIAAMGGALSLVCVLVSFLLPAAGTASAVWYLSYWLKQGSGAGWYLSYWLKQGSGNTSVQVGNVTVPSTRVVDNPELETYLLIYAAFLPLLIIVIIIKSFTLRKLSLKASTHLHNKGFKHVLQSPVSFFDTTPVGRIVNRFSADIDELDSRLPMNVDVFLSNVMQIVAALVIIAYVLPWFLVAVVPLAVIVTFLMVMFHKCVQELKYLENITRSPVMSHMGSSVQGLASIAAYQKSADFFKKHCQLLNTNAVALMLFYVSNRWLTQRLDMISGVVCFVSSLLILITYDYISPSLAGLALSYAIQLTGLFQFAAVLAIETEARFTSVQRFLEYCDLEQQEATEEVLVTQPVGWPKEGAIRFSDVRLRYKTGGPLALKGLNFRIESREKIGIVGRTGAGKTSLTAVLFRLNELESGHVTIDGVDIATLALHDLRKRLSIIPQDPVLFVGTLRYNLDPFNQFSDASIWDALEKCHISNMIRTLEQQLDTIVVENGDNFSVGEKQLICMARALLRSSKILILDEATAAIDSETDSLVQQTLKDAFSDCTMLIIAHRLHTVLGCDKILVMEDGNVLEFDKPSALLDSPNSRFKTMLNSMNLQSDDKMES
ncbi:ATP-binding cassette sub-family C member 5-like [Physella acuta]|uniref:ATP-binding cassette sub-family C member 5-like n=1 Tax=Physella acuta TaxID=109671 RepID=UPI0027DB5734|nr:ATP-binding cassette sub-family C member 5-like [Physella acuta]